MTNPYQQGSSGFHMDHSGLPSGLPGFGQRRTSYASVASGTGAGYGRATRFAHLLNPIPDTADGLGFYPSRNHDTDSLRSGAEPSARARWLATGQRSSELPPYSRAFEPFTQAPSLDSFGRPAPSNTGFFTPSYLQGSVYLQRLEDQHRAKLAAQRESQGLSSQGGAGGLPSSASSLSLHGAGKLAPQSHRGMAYDVVERHTSAGAGSAAVPSPSSLEDDDDDAGMSPLPTRWNKSDKSPSLDVLVDGLDVKYTAARSTSDRDHEASSIRADNYMPPQCGIYYFEVAILTKKREDKSTIGIGFSDRSVALSRAPGWEPTSWGYHGDDGHIFASQNVGKPYGPTFTTGDVIGCGLNFRTGCAFFTKNGKHLGVAFRDVKGPNLKLYPTVGLKKTGEHIRANFGQVPFSFDIDDMMKREVQLINKQITITSTTNLVPGLNATELVQQIVLQFLQHDGYMETARAFAENIREQKKALNLDPNVEVEGINVTDDEDAHLRQRIRRSVLKGDIDYAMKQTNAFYPQVLKENEHVYFRLRCRKFIEMIRQEAEMKRNRRAEKSSGGSGLGSGSSATNDVPLDMDVDDVDMEDSTAANGDGDVDVEDSADSGADPRTMNLVNEALAYGQALAAEYNDDPRPEVGKALQEIFSLMAYESPLKAKEVAYLLDRRGRVLVAEELNSAILQSLGKSSRSALENLYAQTSVLLKDITQGGGAGSFVTIQKTMDQIPKYQPF